MKSKFDFQIDFIGVGTPKCGTEWLVACLKDHPEVEFSKHKEPNFFLSPLTDLNKFVYDNIRVKSLDEYRNEYAFDEGKVKGEFSIQYIFDSEALKKVKNAFPDVKVIVALRDPVKFLHSMYWYMKYSNVYHLVPDTFEEALKSAKKGDPYNKRYAKLYDHVKTCIDIFGEENTLIILQDEMIKNPGVVIKKIYEFIGVNPGFKPEALHLYVNKTQPVRFTFLMPVVNVLISGFVRLGLGQFINYLMNTTNIFRDIYRRIMHVERKYPEMDKEVESKLRKEFVNDIEKLERLLGRDLSNWK